MLKEYQTTDVHCDSWYVSLETQKENGGQQKLRWCDDLDKFRIFWHGDAQQWKISRPCGKPNGLCRPIHIT